MPIVGLDVCLEVLLVQGEHVGFVDLVEQVQGEGAIIGETTDALGASFQFEGHQDLVLTSLEVFLQLVLGDDSVAVAEDHGVDFEVF